MPRAKKVGPRAVVKFCRLLANGVTPADAAADCGIHRQRFYELRLADDDFRFKWAAAEETYLESKREPFLQYIADHGDATDAAEAVGVPRRTMYNWRARDPEFETQWAAAAFEYDDAVVKGQTLRELMVGQESTLRVPTKDADSGEVTWNETEKRNTVRTADKLRYLQLNHPDFKRQVAVSGPKGGPVAVVSATLNFDAMKVIKERGSDIPLDELAAHYQTILDQSRTP